jgi:hypothetical protein
MAIFFSSIYRGMVRTLSLSFNYGFQGVQVMGRTGRVRNRPFFGNLSELK